MKSYLKIAVLAFAVLTMSFEALAINAGSDELAAVALTAPKDSWQAKTVTVTGAYEIDFDNNGNEIVTYSTDFYVYYLKVTLTKGTSYTFNIKFNNDTESLYMYGADFYSDSMVDYHYDSDVVVDGTTYNCQFQVYGSDWDFVDEDQVTCYIAFSGDRGRQGTVRYKTGVDIPEGLEENPKILTVGSGFSNDTGTLTAEHGGYYFCKANLVAGRKYRFKSTSGTSTYPVDLLISPLPAGAKLIDTNDVNNVGYEFMAAESGSYEIALSTVAASVAFQYGQYPVRPVANHPAVALSAGMRKEFSPGHMNAEGSDYFDTIIDESLFSFSATAGRRYRIETDSANVPLRMELYNANGEVLAKNTCITASDKNVRVSFAAPSSATYYVGICQDVDDDVAISSVRAGISLVDVTDSTDGRDDVATATALSPVISAVYNYPAVIDPAGRGVFTLSAAKWRNTFAIAARSGWTYYLFAEKNDGVNNGNGISGTVFTKNSDSETAVPSFGDITVANSVGLYFTADANATHYVRLCTSDSKGNVTEGLDYGSYILHVSAVPPGGSSGYAVLQVIAKGPSSDDGATWRITSGTAETEPDYPYGTTIPVIASESTFTVSYGAVDNMSVTPQSTNIQYVAGAENTILAVYSDTYDPGDDTMAGALQLAFGQEAKTLAGRTLWTEDSADWFSFTATAGMFYIASFTESTGAPRIAFTDAEGNELAYGTQMARFGATKDGTYYVKVCHADNAVRIDSTYKLSYKSVNAGFVSFSDGGVYSVAKDAAYAELTVNRSSPDGALRLDYGTISGTATPGEDYSPTNGTLSWADGDSSARTIRVPLVPNIRPENEGDERFFVKIAAKPDAALDAGEYPAIISGSAVAEVTIVDSGDAETGTISFTAVGAERIPLASGQTVFVHPGDTAILWVTREGGSNGVAEVSILVDDDDEWATLKWESGEAGTKMFALWTDSAIDSPETLQVKMVRKSGAATFGRSAVNVVVDPDTPAISYPGDEGELRLASGSFRGILFDDSGIASENGLAELAEISMTASASGLAATVRVAGETYEFAAKSYEPINAAEDSGDFRTVRFSYVHEVNGESYEDYLDVEVCNAPFSSMNREFPSFSSAVLSLHLPSADGISAMCGEWSGSLLRDNRDVPDNAVAASVYKGRYTIALVASEQPFDDEPKGNGYLTMDVAEDGSVSVSGTLADGTQIAIDTLATFDGYLADAPYGLWAYIPLYWQSGNSLFGGIIELDTPYGGVPVVYSPVRDMGDALMVWNADEPVLSLSGLSVRRHLMPVGGLYDASVNATAYLYGRSVSAMTDGYDLYFSDNVDEIGFAVEQSTGLVSGTVPVDGTTNAEFSGVVIQNCWEMKGLAFDGLFATGTLFLDDDTYPFSIYADETDGDYTEDYGLVSTISFNGNGNTSGNVPEPIKATVKSIEFIPPLNDNFQRTGYEFLGWTDGSAIYQPGDEIVVPAADIALKALWNFIGAEEALGLGATAFAFDMSGDVEWFATDSKATEGKTSMRSGRTTDKQMSVLSATAKSSGTLDFDWAASCDEIRYAWCSFAVNGVEKGRIGGVADWAAVEVDVEAGDVMTWTFAKQVGAYSYPDERAGSDCAWVDNFRFGKKSKLTFIAKGADVSETNVFAFVDEPIGALPEPIWTDYSLDYWEDPTGGVVTASWIVPDEATTITAVKKAKEWRIVYDLAGGTAVTVSNESYVVGATFTLPGADSATKDGYTLAGWSYGTATYAPGATFTVPGGSDVVLLAAWSLAGLDAVLGPGAKSFAFDTSGDADWFVDEAKSADGDGKSMRSGEIGKSASSVLTATAKSSGTLSFRWAASCDEIRYAWCAFAVNGVEKGRIGGVADWAAVELDVAAGDVLTWTYTKGSDAYGIGDSGYTAQDCVWVDGMGFGSKTTVTFVAEGGDPATTNVVAFAGEPIGELPYPTWTNYSLDYWEDPTGGVVTASWIVPETAVTLTAVTKAKEWRVTYDLAGGTAVTVSNESYAVGSVFALPGADSATKDGYALAGWSDGTATYAPGAMFTVPGGRDVILAAVWSLAGLDAVLGPGASAFAFETSGDADWFVDDAKSADGDGKSMRSGAIGKNASSVLAATAKSAGTLSFKWAASCDEIGYAWCAFAVNGVEKGRIGGVADWAAVEIDVAAGDRLTWTYTKSSSAYGVGDSGYTAMDCVWVDGMGFGSKTTVTFVADGGDPAETNVVAFAGAPIGELPYPTWADYSLDHWADPTGGVVTASWIVPEEAVTLTAVKKAKEWRVTYDLAGGTAVTVSNESYAAGSVFALPGADSATKDGYALAGWSDGTATYAPGAMFTVPGGTDLSFTAVWQPDYASALDCKGAGLAFLSGGDAEWIVQSEKTSLGATAVRSGVIGGTGNTASSDCASWIEAEFIGAGTVSFDWAVSCDDGYNGQKYAWAECSLNGVQVGNAIYGTADAGWKSVEIELPEGTNLLRWTFSKIRTAYNLSSGRAGEDRAWLDNVRWTPAVPPGVDFAMEYDDSLFAGGVMVSNDTAKASVEVSDKAFKAQTGDVLVFTLASSDNMPVYSAKFGGADLTKVAYGVYSFVVGEAGGIFSFSSAEAAVQPDDEVAQAAAKEAISESVVAPAEGKTLEETKQMVAAQVDAILAAYESARASDVAAWIEEGGFTGAQVATARAIDVSYGLNAEALFANDPVAVVDSIESSLSAEGTVCSLVFRITDGASGDAVVADATDAAKAYVQSLVEVTTDLADWTMVPVGVTVVATYDKATSDIMVSVSLPKGLTSAFMRIRK